MKMYRVQSCRRRPRWTVAALVAVGLAASWAVVPRTGVCAEEPAIEQANALSRAFRSAAKKVLPTVVKIRVTSPPVKGKATPEQPNPFKGTPFEDYFGDEMPGFRFHGQVPRRSGVGSGVIIDASGIILTNNHVVEGGGEVVVELADGRSYKAADIKRDEQSDLAVVRIKAEGSLPAATLGDSDQIEIGDWVLAIGTPFELDQTVSAGIISAKGRGLGDTRAKYLQTDAAINPGNSGGPLVNLNGEVVGISTAIASSNGSYQGVGFAIAANTAKWVSRQLIETGNVQRAYLGVGVQKPGGELAGSLGVSPGKGIVVSEVFEGSPAAEAGLQEGDVIIRFAGQPVDTPIQLQEAVERCPMGSKQKADILREGKPQTLEVVVKTLPADFGAAPRGPRQPRRQGETPSYDSKELGLSVADLTPEVAKQLGYAGAGGVVVTEVDPAGIAAGADVREGAIILRVGRAAVANIAEFKAAVEKQSLADGVMLLVRFGGGNRYVILKK
jgi:serine protease Do